MLEGTSVNLSLSFVDSESGAPVELPCLHLGAFGLHNGENGDAQVGRAGSSNPRLG